MGQALYRKYRSKSLVELLGQEHITTTLSNALKAGRISHAYLLTGPHGVGKTSIARILAHEINGLPYTDEAHLDIIEIDAASNRRIDEIRDLRDRVNTAPASARYKVYIIDEVHMLTREAFNALLKTLEEPPAHVVFILATTEAHKLPETIISRTQHYIFRPVPTEQVIAHLRFIAQSEKITIDDDALELLATHGQGSFRDSISLLDQASSTSQHITRAEIERILGLAPAQQIEQLRQALATNDSRSIVTGLSDLYGQGYEPAAVASQLAAILRQQVLDGVANAAQLLALLQQLLDVPAARSPRQLLELLLLRASLGGPAAPPAVLSEGISTPKPAVTQKAAEPAQQTVAPKAPAAIETTVPSPSEAAPPKTEESPPATAEKEITSEPATTSTEDNTTQSDMDVSELWQQTLNEIKKQYNTLYGIARMAQPQLSGDTLTLVFKFAFHQKRMNEAKNRKIFADAAERLVGKPLEIICIVAEPEQTVTAQPEHIATVSNIFGGAELIES